MNKLPKDMIWSLALELDNKTIANFCLSSKKFNNMICKNDSFWRNKFEKERPGLISFLYDQDGEIEIPYKELYFFFQETKDNYSIAWDDRTLEIYGIVKGDYYDEIVDMTKEDLLGKKVWLIVSSKAEFPPVMYATKEEAFIALIDDIEYALYNEEETREIDYYIEEAKENDYVKIGEFEFLLEEVLVL